jgi:hypothetical protein
MLELLESNKTFYYMHTRAKYKVNRMPLLSFFPFSLVVLCFYSEWISG